MTETPAEGVTGYLLYNPLNGKLIFRVYSEDRKTHVDYKITAEDITVTIQSKAISLYTDASGNRVDWASRYLNRHRESNDD